MDSDSHSDGKTLPVDLPLLKPIFVNKTDRDMLQVNQETHQLKIKEEED